MRQMLGRYVFAAVPGFTRLATVPPTAGLIGKLFGVRYLATLFGLVTLTHQVGGFLGAWLGGLALTRFGDFSGKWRADAALAQGAALLNLPTREAPSHRSCAGMNAAIRPRKAGRPAPLTGVKSSPTRPAHFS